MHEMSPSGSGKQEVEQKTYNRVNKYVHKRKNKSPLLKLFSANSPAKYPKMDHAIIRKLLYSIPKKECKIQCNNNTHKDTHLHTDTLVDVVMNVII